MMETMRKMAPAVIIVVVIAFGGASLIGFGANSSAMKEANRAIGTVAGEPVTRMEFDKTIRRAQGNDMSDAQRRQLPMRVWEEIVARKIGEKVAKDMKLDATSAEVLRSLLENPPEALTKAPYFADETGAFSEEKYREIMTTAETYDIGEIQYLQEQIRSMIPNQKLGALIEMTNMVSPSEIEAQYHRENDKVQFEYIMARPFAMTVAPEKLNEAAIEEYYKSHEEDFTTKEQAELYYVKIAKTATAYDEKVLTEQLVEAKKRILNGSSTFSDEASGESDDDQSAMNGGALGWMVKGDFPAFDGVYSLKVGEITEPITSRLGLHIVRVDSIDATNETGRMYVSHILKEILPTVVTLDSLDALGESLTRAADTLGLENAAAALKVTLDSTGLFGKGDAVPGIGYFSNLGNLAFDKSDEVEIELFENEKNIFVVTSKSQITEGTLPLERVSTKIKQILRDSLQIIAAEEYVAAQLSKVTGSLKDLADADSLLTGGITDSVTRSEFVSGVGFNNKVIASAFLTDLNKVSGAIAESNGVYAVKPVAQVVATKITPEASAKTAKTMRENRTKTLFNEWYVAYREQIGVTEDVRNFYY